MIIADTHAWVWWVGARRLLSRKALRAFDSADEIGVSVISCWEVVMLVAKRRLELDRDVETWIAQALALPRVGVLDLTPDVALAATKFVGWRDGDPADRIIVATAMAHRASVVTKDRRILAFSAAQSVW